MILFNLYFMKKMKFFFSYIGILLIFIPTLVQGQIRRFDELEFTKMTIYAIPLASRTRRAWTSLDVKTNYAITISTRDIDTCYDILFYNDSLQIREPIPFDNVRIVCEIFSHDSCVFVLNIHAGEVISVGNDYYLSNDKLLSYIYYFLPEDYYY